MVDARSSAFDARRFARHLSLDGFGAAGQQRLADARVLVIGAGGLGSPVVSYLAGSGVGHIVVMDPDVVELSNLPRQIIHTEARIGLAKVDSAERAVAAQNADVSVVGLQESLTVARALELVADADVVIDCSDSVDVRYVLNDACVLLGVPLVWASIAQYAGQFGVVDAGRGPCYRCVFPDPRAVAGSATCEEAGVLGVLPGVIGTMQAVEVVKLCAGIGEPARRGIRLYDASSATMTTLPVAPDPRCRVCGAGEAYFVGIDEGPRDEGGSVPEIEPDAWPSDEHVVVDVRGVDEAAAAPLPAWMVDGAADVALHPWDGGWDAATTDRVRAWAAGRDIVTVCARGARSRAAASALIGRVTEAGRGARPGTARVVSLAGGLATVDAAVNDVVAEDTMAEDEASESEAAGGSAGLIERVAEVVADVPPGQVTTYGTIAALVGTGPRQIGRVLATADADWPWWRVTNARGALPDALWERARRHYATEGTPVRDGRVDLGRARWAPPV